MLMHTAKYAEVEPN